jgi:hypothetical protein
MFLNFSMQVSESQWIQDGADTAKCCSSVWLRLCNSISSSCSRIKISGRSEDAIALASAATAAKGLAAPSSLLPLMLITLMVARSGSLFSHNVSEEWNKAQSFTSQATPGRVISAVTWVGAARFRGTIGIWSSRREVHKQGHYCKARAGLTVTWRETLVFECAAPTCTFGADDLQQVCLHCSTVHR